MNTITFKVAPKGEGKTKWLLDIAAEYKDTGRPIYLYTDDSDEYRKFCDKYFYLFDAICPVRQLAAFKLTPDAVILVDDLFHHCAEIGDFTYISRNCYRMFITIEGTTEVVTDNKARSNFIEQLTIDTQEVPNA